MKIFQKGHIYSSYKIDKIELINFPTKNAIKIIPFYESIPHDERADIKDKICKECKIDLRTGDWLGKLMIDIVYLFYHDIDMVVVNTAGLTDQSILFLEQNISIMAEIQNKVIIVNRN